MYELNTKESLDVLDQLIKRNVKVLSISGGDPLLRKDLVKLVGHAVKGGMRVRIQTNGQLVNDKILDDLKKAGCDEIGIGLDSCSSKYHDWLRNKPGVFKKTIDAIKKIKANEFRVHVEFTMNPKNKDELHDVLELCKSLDVDTFFSRAVIPVGRGTDENLMISREKYSGQLTNLSKEKYLHSGIKIASEDPLWILADEPLFNKVSLENPCIRNGEYISGCLAGINMFYIKPSGKVYPCSFINVELGDLRTQKLNEILKNTDKKIPFTNRDNLKGKCAKCDMKFLCGGCRARAFFKYGDYCAEYSYCWRKIKT
jgi:radical SAM protein with 4Fe4S-binding SPASM domain